MQVITPGTMNEDRMKMVMRASLASHGSSQGPGVVGLDAPPGHGTGST